jgi:hypothetical protein
MVSPTVATRSKPAFLLVEQACELCTSQVFSRCSLASWVCLHECMHEQGMGLLQLRTFLELSGKVQVISNETSASLARSVEGWSFHETILEQGRVLLRRKLQEACITMAHQQRELGHSSIPPPVLGHLDMLSVLLANDLSLRKQIMASLRKTLSPRQMCLVLVVQVRTHVSMPPTSLSTLPCAPCGGLGQWVTSE